MSISDSIQIGEVEVPLALVIVIIIGLYGVIFTVLRSRKAARRRYQEQVEQSLLLDSAEDAPLRKHPMKPPPTAQERESRQKTNDSGLNRQNETNRNPSTPANRASRKVVRMNFGHPSPSPRSKEASD